MVEDSNEKKPFLMSNKRLKVFHFFFFLTAFIIFSILSFKIYLLIQEVDTLKKQDCSDTNIVSTISYDIFGESEFDTVVTGYLTTKTVPAQGDIELEHAYLAITDFEDEEFRESIKNGIEESNGVNKFENGTYLFNLGCFYENEINPDQQSDVPYLDEITHTEILESTKENPVTVRLYFEKHFGSGCDCCNLAERIREL